MPADQKTDNLNEESLTEPSITKNQITDELFQITHANMSEEGSSQSKSSKKKVRVTVRKTVSDADGF